MHNHNSLSQPVSSSPLFPSFLSYRLLPVVLSPHSIFTSLPPAPLAPRAQFVFFSSLPLRRGGAAARQEVHHHVRDIAFRRAAQRREHGGHQRSRDLATQIQSGG